MRGRGAKINGRVGCEHEVDAAKECLAAHTLEKKHNNREDDDDDLYEYR